MHACDMIGTAATSCMHAVASCMVLGCDGFGDGLFQANTMIDTKSWPIMLTFWHYYTG
jgi:hypothetical protein